MILIAQYIHQKKAYKVKLKMLIKISFLMKQADLNKFDKIIDELEPVYYAYQF
jgi:hypothetical protein